jgi:hypothetical protein
VTSPASMPTPEPPSAGRLLRSTLIALGVAGLILVTIVLPAEYGVDPTGVGRLLGLKEMGQIKMRIAREEAGHTEDEAAAAPSGVSTAVSPAGATTAATVASATKSDVTEVVIPPTQAREIKLVMQKDARVSYAWAANRGVVNYDTHADNPSIRYHGYTKGRGVRSDSGSLVAAFDGQHGWFWRNRSSDTVVVTLRTRGAYREIKWIQ